MFSLPDLALVTLVSFLTLTIALRWAARPMWPGSADKTVAPSEPVALLFEDGLLNHTTARAATMLALQPGHHGWDDMRDAMIARFPDFPAQAGGGEKGSITLRAQDAEDMGKAVISWRGALCWVELREPDPQQHPSDPGALKELASLRRMSDTAPNPIWEEDETGRLRWCNAAYRSLHRMILGEEATLHEKLFDDPGTELPQRVALTSDIGQSPDWYELTSVETHGVTVYHATCINALVEAEEAQRTFVQTLAKTFAHLSIGLAIFDRDKQLALFNPALVDLTGLPAHFLSARPTMISFFDQLRENRRMPEPKNYRSWRQEITDVIAAASDGRYQETWTLESGQTYSVTGRPHPDGATAFLIEDKSAEMMLTRNFRAELQQAQTLIDAVDDAMVIFSPSGVLTSCNASYRKLWQVDPEQAFADVTMKDALNHWRDHLNGKSSLTVIERMLDRAEAGKISTAPVHMAGGRQMSCQVVPIANGATLVRFHQLPEEAASEHKIDPVP